MTLNLSTGKYQPYRKPCNYPLYINAKSNHPPPIIKNLPASISNRISGLSWDSNEFNKASQIYNGALKTSGYREDLQYVRNHIPADRNRRNRLRNIIWFNPPYSANVQMQAPRQTSNAIAERRTFALSMACALPIMSYKRPLSLPHPVMQESTLAWRRKVLRRGSTTTRFPSSTASTRMTLAYPNTSGTLRTAAPISQSSGRLSAVQDLTALHSICWQINTS